MKEKQLSRKERRFLQDRQLIMDTAARLFPENGYHNVSIHEIAKKAEFAVGTLYKFFNTKDDLYKSIFVDMIRDLISRNMALLDGKGDVITILRDHLTFVTNTLYQHHSARYESNLVVGIEISVPGSLTNHQNGSEFIKPCT